MAATDSSTIPDSLPWASVWLVIVNNDGEMRDGGTDEAAYAAHAANTYPVLVEALRFYADAELLYLGKGNWQTRIDEASDATPVSHVATLTQDNGATARAALQEAGEAQ